MCSIWTHDFGQTLAWKRLWIEDPEAASGIYFMIGNAWFEQESYLNAVEYYKEAVVRNTENPEYYRDYAIALARMAADRGSGENFG